MTLICVKKKQYKQALNMLKANTFFTDMDLIQDANEMYEMMKIIKR